MSRTYGEHIYFTIFTSNIWSYLLWPPVISLKGSLDRNWHTVDSVGIPVMSARRTLHHAQFDVSRRVKGNTDLNPQIQPSQVSSSQKGGWIALLCPKYEYEAWDP